MDVPSVFTLRKVGFGPSSSHKVGPYLAARDFRGLVAAQGVAGGRLRVALLGSLARTGGGTSPTPRSLPGLRAMTSIAVW